MHEINDRSCGYSLWSFFCSRCLSIWLDRSQSKCPRCEADVDHAGIFFLRIGDRGAPDLRDEERQRNKAENAEEVGLKQKLSRAELELEKQQRRRERAKERNEVAVPRDELEADRVISEISRSRGRSEPSEQIELSGHKRTFGETTMVTEAVHWCRLGCPIFPSEQPKLREVIPCTIFPEAGLADLKKELQLYFRAEAFSLWNKLSGLGSNSQSTRHLRVQGSPGVGKSCIVWGWALYKGFVENKRVLWIRVYRNKPTRCVRIVQKSIEVILPLRKVFLNKVDFAVEEIALRCEWDVIILDGVTEHVNKHMTTLYGCTYDSQTVSVVTGTGSLKAEPNDDRADRIENYEVLPWNIDEYKIACGSELFLKSVIEMLEVPGFPRDTLDDMVERKYFYAGVSARWMFEWTVQEIIREVDIRVSQIINKADFIEGKVGDRSIENRNYLFMKQVTSRNNTTVAFVSAFVVKSLVRGEGLRGLELAYNIAKKLGNPAIWGSIMEMDFLSHLEDFGETGFEQGLVLEDQVGRKIVWVRSPAVYVDLDFLDSQPFGSNIWVKPKNWKERGFDLIRLSKVGHEDHHVEFVQVTSNTKVPSVRLGEFRKLLDAITHEWNLVITYVSIYMVIPRINQNNFEIRENAIESTGDLSRWKVFSNSAHWQRGREASLIKVLIFDSTVAVVESWS